MESSEAGEPYKAKFTDAVHGNYMEREVARPALLSFYLGVSDKVDSHNNKRQGILRLAKKWKTQDCYFRLFTTIVGMMVIDSWLAYQYHLNSAHPLRAPDFGVINFAEALAR